MIYKKILFVLLFFGLTGALYAGEQDTMGKTKLTFTIVAPGNLAQEGNSYFFRMQYG